MEKHTQKELEEALKVVVSTIANCEKMYPKFKEGKSQHTLLKNRINALYISKDLISNKDITSKYTKEDLIEALAPISSIISKCEKGQSKFEEASSSYKRFEKMIRAMYISKSLIEKAIE